MVNRQLLRSFIALSWLALVIIILLLCAPLLLPVSVEEPEKTRQAMFCGTQSLGPSPSDELFKSFANGKKLFKVNCATCHNKNMRDDLTGPALAGLQERWQDYPREDLYQWIRNSQVLIDQGHPRALSLWNTWNRSVMSSFSQLTDQEIADLLFYIERNN